MDSSMMESIRPNTGKWDDPDVPQEGWGCLSVVDLGLDEKQICDMCERKQIRFVHLMSHPDHDEVEADLKCAGFMEGNEGAAKERDGYMTSRATRRARWAALRAANDAKGSDHHIKVKKQGVGYQIVFTRSDDNKYSGFIENLTTGNKEPLKDSEGEPLSLDSEKEATLEMFDFLWPPKWSPGANLSDEYIVEAEDA